MHTSHIQFGVVALLAAALGFAASSTEAIGYSAGSVSLGTNPIRSFGGTIAPGASVALSVALADQDFVITDISFQALSQDPDCLDFFPIRIESGGVTLAAYTLATMYASGGFHSHGQHVSQSMVNGIRVPAGSSLELATDSVRSWTSGSCWSGRETLVHYTVSGRYVQP
jgi:hypothetical protein